MSGQSSNRENDMYEMIKKFRASYPEGRIAINVSPNGECIMARVRIYPCYKEEEKNYLSEATTVSPLGGDKTIQEIFEEVQQDAVVIALRCAGIDLSSSPKTTISLPETATSGESYEVQEESQKPIGEMSFDERYNAALNMPCPISKYNGYTLGQVLCMERNAIVWVRDKFTGDNAVKEAAKFLLENAG